VGKSHDDGNCRQQKAPGERFDVRVVRDGQFMLTRLEPARRRPAKATLRKMGRYSVGPISVTALREALAEQAADFAFDPRLFVVK
jgi:hypothetical protein